MPPRLPSSRPIGTRPGLTAVIERQLAHAERNKVKAPYNYAEHLPERRKMMQAWADHIDDLVAGKAATVVNIRSKAG